MLTKILLLPLFISTTEMLFVAFIIVLVFGADKIPEIARGLGKGMRMLKDASQDLKYEITQSAKKQGLDTHIPKQLNEDIKGVKEDIEQITGSIKREL